MQRHERHFRSVAGTSRHRTIDIESALLDSDNSDSVLDDLVNKTVRILMILNTVEMILMNKTYLEMMMVPHRGREVHCKRTDLSIALMLL